jgi:Protein of unknown function (DUF3800)
MASVELKAFVDESGTHDSNLTVMAGCVGYAERWAEFEAKWKLMLLRHGLPYIHAIDVRHGRKAFKDKIKWPPPRRLAVAQEAGRLVESYALFSLSVFLKRADYDALYIGGDKSLRKHRAAIDSKYGVCARVFMSMLAEFVERYGGPDAQATIVLEAGAKNQGAVQAILSDMYDIAPDRARFLSPNVVYALKPQSPGVQAADCLAYPVYANERDSTAEVLPLDQGFPDSLPANEVMHFRSPISAKTLQDLKQGQIAMGGLRRRFGRHWSALDGFPKGWTVQPLEVGGFVLMPPRPSRSLQPEGALRPQAPEPIGFVHLECE